MQYNLRRLVKAGKLKSKRQYNGMNLYGLKDDSIEIISYTICDDDPRYSPRIGKKYVDVGNIITQILYEQGHPCHQDEIFELTMKRIRNLKQAALVNIHNIKKH